MVTKSSSKDSAALSANTQCFKSRPARKAVDNQHCQWTVTDPSHRSTMYMQLLDCTASVTLSFFYIKVPISSKFLFSQLILHFMQWTSVKKLFNLDKNRFCYECLKIWKSYFLTIDPCCWSQHWHAQSCDVDSGTCNFRLDLSRLFYLAL